MSSSSRDAEWQSLKRRFKQLRVLIRSSNKAAEVKAEVDELLAYFAAYFESPHRYEADNVLQIMSGIHRSPLEASFMWMGAWRPSAVVSHVFSAMGLQQIDGFTNGSSSSGSLCEEQCSRLHDLQKRCSRVEEDVSNAFANVQMMLPDQRVVNSVMVNSCIGDIMGGKVASLSELLRRADALRVSTLRQVHAILNPMQAAHCSLAAFELAFAMRSL